MEKLSRVKKYEQLRKEIELSHSDEIQSGELKEYANKLNAIDPVLFKKMEVSEEKQEPRRTKTYDTSLISTNEPFENEYMDDLIRDVKQYNIEKGLLNSDNTEIHILNQLKTPTRLKRENYVKPLDEPKVEDVESTLHQSKMEIARQIQELLQEEPADSGMVVTKIETDATPTIENKIQSNNPVEEVHEEVTCESSDGEEVDEALIEKLNEATQQIQIRINQHEEEMSEINDGIDKTNKLLNVILFILVVALFAVIGVIVFTILKDGGKI